jgi:hypothetical protein
VKVGLTHMNKNKCLKCNDALFDTDNELLKEYNSFPINEDNKFNYVRVCLECIGKAFDIPILIIKCVNNEVAIDNAIKLIKIKYPYADIKYKYVREVESYSIYYTNGFLRNNEDFSNCCSEILHNELYIKNNLVSYYFSYEME